MKSIKKAIAGSYIQSITEYFNEHHNLDTQEFLQCAGINFSKNLFNRQFSSDEYINIIKTASQHTQPYYLAKELAAHNELTQHGLLGLIALCGVNLRLITKTVIKFYKLQTHLVNLEFIENDNEAIIRVSSSINLKEAEEFTTLITLMVIHQSAKQLTNHSNSTGEIHISHPRPKKFDITDTVYKFNQAYNQIIFPSAYLDTKIKSAHKPTYDILTSQCETNLFSNALLESTIKSKIKALFKNHDNKLPSLDEAAKDLAVSTRTLSRQLKALDLTYQQLIDQERISRAKLLLIDNEINITEIAARLYFTDASHFTKMFKRYVKISPSDYRADNQLN